MPICWREYRIAACLDECDLRQLVKMADDPCCACGRKSYEHGANVCKETPNHQWINWVNGKMGRLMPWLQADVIDDFCRDRFVTRRGIPWEAEGHGEYHVSLHVLNVAELDHLPVDHCSGCYQAEGTSQIPEQDPSAYSSAQKKVTGIAGKTRT